MLKQFRMMISYLKDSLSAIKQYIMVRILTEDDKIIQILTLTKEVQDLQSQMQKQDTFDVRRINITTTD